MAIAATLLPPGPLSKTTHCSINAVHESTLKAGEFAAAGAKGVRGSQGVQGTLALHLLTCDLPLLHRKLQTCSRTDDETNERDLTGETAGVRK